MSTKIIPTKTISFYVNTRGFSYAVMQSALELNEVNMFDYKKFDVLNVMSKMREVVNIHAPATIILEDTNSKYCRKGAQTKQVIRAISFWCKKKGHHTKLYSRDDVRTVFEPWQAKTKYEISEVIWRNIPAMKMYMFEKPKYPNREPNVEILFSTISFTVTHYYKSNY